MHRLTAMHETRRYAQALARRNELHANVSTLAYTTNDELATRRLRFDDGGDGISEALSG